MLLGCAQMAGLIDLKPGGPGGVRSSEWRAVRSSEYHLTISVPSIARLAQW
jgi:hypothetical protein